MARPKKATELKRSHPIMLRLTDTEYEIISENAKAAALPLAEYARRLVMGKQLKKFIAEFGKIGSNLNQVARHFNSGGIHSQEIKKAINQGIADIYEMKYKVLKMAGEFQNLSVPSSSPGKGDAFHGNPETYRQ